MLIRWYTTQLVRARAARAHFATSLKAIFRNSAQFRQLEEECPEAKALDIDGRTTIGELFNTVVRKHQVERADKPRTIPFVRNYATKPSASSLQGFYLEVFAFDGDNVPDWLHVRHGMSSPQRTIILDPNATSR